MPSTCGWTVVERSERIEAMNSDVWGTGFGARVIVWTGVGGGASAAPPDCGGAPQFTVATARKTTERIRGMVMMAE